MRFSSSLAVVVALALLTNAAQAGAPRAGKQPRSSEHYGFVPPKDCTRLNGRYGYYGNPWCSWQEQLLWDRWEAEKIRRSMSRGR